MKVTVQWQNSEHPTEYDMPEEILRGGLDFAIRHNPQFWELVRDIAGNYQAELMAKELKRRKLFKNKKKS